MITRVHVNQHNIRSNKKHGTTLPVISIKRGGKTIQAFHSVSIAGPATVVYSPDKPLSCGARVWIETTADIQID